MYLHMQLHGPLFWKVNRPLRKIGLNMKKLLLRQYLATLRQRWHVTVCPTTFVFRAFLKQRYL